MNSFRHFALGEPLSESPHSVASSLPTLADVCGYEENDPRVTSAIKIGYPRFVLHPYVRQLTNLFLERNGLADRFGALVANLNAAQDLLTHINFRAAAIELEEGLQLVYCNAEDHEVIQKIRKYLQHVGCGVSSRQAEAILVSLGHLSESYDETLFEKDALAEVSGRLADLFGCDDQDVWVCASGMNAFYTGFRAVQAVLQNQGRTCWVQLGWLYLDSGCVLKTFLENGETLEYCYDVMDADAVIDKLSALGNRLAGVVVECPTNPLVQVCDLERVSEAVHTAGGLLIIDPTVASVYNMDVLPYADVLVTSLTKYAAYEGDVMIGSLALNRESAHYEALQRILPKFQAPPYTGCLKRLSYEMQYAAEKVAQMNNNARQLVKFLKAHPAVSSVYYAADSPHHAKFARSDHNGGAMISIELAGSMQQFYDKIAVMKGPSFGSKTTLLCPFMYLAHYDLVTQETGRSFLREAGLSPELIRISVGTEPYGEIEAVFAEALDE